MTAGMAISLQRTNQHCLTVHPTSLTPADLAKFNRFGIPPDLLSEAQVQRVTDREARERYGIAGTSTSDMSGIVFPYLSLTTGQRLSARVRRDNPEIEKGKERHKYVSAYGDRKHLFFPPHAGDKLQEPNTPIVLVEAEKSCLALTAWSERARTKLVAVAMGGCWGWLGRIGKTENPKGERVDDVGPLPDLAVCSNRSVIVMLDSNADTKTEVRAARSALVRVLGQMQAKVRIASVPALDGVNGPDDLIAVRGDSAIQHVLEHARLSADLALAEAEVAIEKIIATKPNISTEQMRCALDAIANISDAVQRSIWQSKLVAAVRGLVPKNVLVSEVTKRRQDREAREQNFSRKNREAELRALPIDTAQLIVELETFFAERAHLPQGAALVLAFTVLNTRTFNLFDTVPYLLLESAVPGCGKSTVIRLLEAALCRARKATLLSEAVMFRLIDAEAPTLLVDEAETIEGRSERAEALRAVAHEGYKKGGQVPRCEATTMRSVGSTCIAPKCSLLLVT